MQQEYETLQKESRDRKAATERKVYNRKLANRIKRNEEYLLTLAQLPTTAERLEGEKMVRQEISRDIEALQANGCDRHGKKQ